jgi:rhamnosyltransferase subunit B
MSRIVLATAGSLGDLHPYLAIGVGLKTRGHQVVVATSEFHRGRVLAAGLEFGSLGNLLSPEHSTEEAMRKAFDRRTGLAYVIKERVLPFVEQSYRDLLAICDDADFILRHPAMFAVPAVAERLGVPWMVAVLSPHTLLSAHDPPRLASAPWMYGLRWMGPLPHTILLGALKAASSKLTEPLVRLRKKEGLRQGPRTLYGNMFSHWGTIACWSSLFAPPQKDWPMRTTATGFAVYESSDSNAAGELALEAFMAAGGPPVVFTLGSAAVLDPGDFFEQSVAAVRQLGHRGVLMVGSDAQRFAALASPEILVTSYAPYSQVFPRAAAVVHHAGVGTTAMALRAGVPSLAVPRGLDQPDNAARLQRLGVALTVEPEDYRSDKIAPRLHRLLDEPAFRSSAQSLASAISAEDGVGNACATIERICHG